MWSGCELWYRDGADSFGGELLTPIWIESCALTWRPSPKKTSAAA